MATETELWAERITSSDPRGVTVDDSQADGEEFDLSPPTPAERIELEALQVRLQREA